MFNCGDYEYVNLEVFCAVARLYTEQLGKSTLQFVCINILSSAITAVNREMMRILQACNPEVKRSKKRGVY